MSVHIKEGNMNFYIAFGTPDFLKKLQNKHKTKNMNAFFNNETAMLLHETTKKSVFAAPRKYEIITGSGDISHANFASFTYVPVSDEGKPLFESQISNMSMLFQNVSGLVAYRVLRPIKSDSFVITTFWENASSYSDWSHSIAFEQLEQLIEKNKAGLNTTIFSGPVYTKTYYLLEDE